MTRAAWPDLPREPWSHQHDAYDRLGSLWYDGQPGVGLISGMGTGKSLVAIALFKAFGFRRVLLVSGAKAMVEEWPDMLANDTGGEIAGVPLLGTVRSRADQLRARLDDPTPQVFVTNVEAFHREPLNSVIERVAWDAIVFDESQKIKAAGSIASLSAFRLAKRQPQAKRLIMTGTPLHDKPLDVYGQMRFADRRIFGTNYEAFKQRYAIERAIAEHVKVVAAYINLDELAEKLHSVCFRVPPDVVDLPELVERDRVVRLSPRTVKAYDTLKRESVLRFEDVDDVLIAPNALAAQTRLQQLTSGYATPADSFGIGTDVLIGTEKRDALIDLFAELDSAQPVVVFCRFEYDLRQIARAAELAGRPYLEQSGRSNDWRAWRSRDDNAVLGVQIQSGGAGIDLTRAPYAVFYSHTFSLGDYEQAVKRVHRPGQTQRTFVYHLIARLPNRRTVDGVIRQALAQKGDVNTYVVDDWRNRE